MWEILFSPKVYSVFEMYLWLQSLSLFETIYLVVLRYADAHVVFDCSMQTVGSMPYLHRDTIIRTTYTYYAWSRFLNESGIVILWRCRRERCLFDVYHDIDKRNILLTYRYSSPRLWNSINWPSKSFSPTERFCVLPSS